MHRRVLSSRQGVDCGVEPTTEEVANAGLASSDKASSVISEQLIETAVPMSRDTVRWLSYLAGAG